MPFVGISPAISHRRRRDAFVPLFIRLIASGMFRAVLLLLTVVSIDVVMGDVFLFEDPFYMDDDSLTYEKRSTPVSPARLLDSLRPHDQPSWSPLTNKRRSGK
ncbi:hypothetical protein Tcan_09416 [Toxocara canis]|uniref:Uncharacterized protein n=1 Tax=Toxocara canis TaxID=6265 RepID=A0A0B2UTE5_TOXCA|nr:hypothetical protein Tcan_09416 [Toxocara canis]